MKLKSCLTMGLMFATAVFGQSSDTEAKAAATSAPVAADSGEDQFSGLRKQADEARAKWRALETSVFDKQLPAIKDNCSPKITSLIDTVQASMEAYMALEARYTKIWADDSHRKLQMTKSTLAAESALGGDLKKLMEDENKDFEDTKARHDALLKLGQQAADVVAEADDLLKQMNDTQAKLNQTIQQMDDISAKTQASDAMVSIREAKLKEYGSSLQASLLGLRTLYLKRKESYNARCVVHDARPPDYVPHVDFGTSDKEKP